MQVKPLFEIRIDRAGTRNYGTKDTCTRLLIHQYTESGKI